MLSSRVFKTSKDGLHSLSGQLVPLLDFPNLCHYCSTEGGSALFEAAHTPVPQINRLPAFSHDQPTGLQNCQPLSGLVFNGCEASHCAPDCPQVLIFNNSVLFQVPGGQTAEAERAKCALLSVCTGVVVDAVISHDIQVIPPHVQVPGRLRRDCPAHLWTVSKCYSALLGGQSTWCFGPIQF